ncbi:hypothetical protein [Gilvimarinus sp. 1_MG-2023]|uniref:hypothetical protein n=1 Tax=Gilvimarinus sp. 1_MG-2023 TaxID=3062638 RepID=UPI0026E40EFA|nr:hypothetical protein [Gilvimarinus sp. 1_MG-2023]MDO6747819.1 hypothetical protein [Gilvimarinus sp. 1_MG-2023]
MLKMTSSTMSIRDYLKHVYPLAQSDLDTISDASVNEFFNSLSFYFQLSPQPIDVIPPGKISPRNQVELPQIGELYWPSVINPQGFWCRNPYDPTNPLNNKFVKGFASGSRVEVCHSNVYNGSAGIYYYLAPGSGIAVDLGKTLVARNKLDVMRKLGCSNDQIATALNTPATAYWPYYTGGQLPPPGSQKLFRDLVSKYVDQYGVTTETAQNAIIDAAIDETNYFYGRVNDTGWQVDEDNFNLAKSAGYDTVQMTTQANMNNGWAFEIIDLRVSPDNNLKTTMTSLTQYHTMVNPFKPSLHQPVSNTWPYYNLYAANTLSEIAKDYPSYQERFPFAGPGYINPTPIPIPGYPH